MPSGAQPPERRWMVYCRTPAGTRVEVHIGADCEMDAMLAAPAALTVLLLLAGLMAGVDRVNPQVIEAVGLAGVEGVVGLAGVVGVVGVGVG